jgi:hypothetical protein
MVSLRSHGAGFGHAMHLYIFTYNMPFRLPVRLELDSGFKLKIRDKHRHGVDWTGSAKSPSGVQSRGGGVGLN